MTNAEIQRKWRAANVDKARAWDRKRARAQKLKLLKLFGNACVDCGYSGHPAALDFDHIDPTTKVGNVGNIRAWDKALNEAQKCLIRCANCHRIKTSLDHP